MERRVADRPKITLSRLPPRLKVANTNTGRTLAQLEPPRMRGRRLQERNARVMARHPLCELCLAKLPPQVSQGVEVDHKVPLHLGGSDTEDNLQALCVPCHEAKSATEAKARADGTAEMVIQKPPREPVLV